MSTDTVRVPTIEDDGYTIVNNADGSQTVTYQNDDWSPEPTTVTFGPLGARVQVIAQDETRWVGEETTYVAKAGMVGTVMGWVPEWFHVDVKLAVGADVWLCPDNLRKIADPS